MDVILHLGAHRTASTSFQHYMRASLGRLEPLGVGFWTPSGDMADTGPVTSGETPDEQLLQARDHIVANLDRAQARGIHTLVISDENVIGTPQQLLREARLYNGIGERMARYSEVFGGRLTRIVLTIRSQDNFWSSVAAQAVAQGQPVPTAEELGRLAAQKRGWRDVITDLACAVSGTDIQIHPFEVFGSLPEHGLTAMAGLETPPTKYAREWLNRSPGRSELRAILTKRREDPEQVPTGDGRWLPFDRDQSRMLREAYADDLFWLRAGASGLAKLIEVTGPAKTGKQPSAGDTIRGQDDGKDDRRLA